MYYYDIHIHTSEVSACGKIDAASQVKYYKNLGADGLCITDHFFNGNTLVPEDLPWEDRVELFFRGYDNAKIAGDKLGMTIMYGWEYTYRGNDFLTYGLDREWLCSHPEIMDMTLVEYCNYVRSQGGIIVHAHPFREDPWIDYIRLLPRCVDAVETLNSRRPDMQNRLADVYASEFGLPKICSSDNHCGYHPRLALMGFEKPVSNIKELIYSILHEEKEFKIIEPEQGE